MNQLASWELPDPPRHQAMLIHYHARDFEFVLVILEQMASIWKRISWPGKSLDGKPRVRACMLLFRVAEQGTLVALGSQFKLLDKPAAVAPREK